MPPPLRAAAAFGLAYRPMTDDDLPFVAALYASTRSDEVAATGWPPEMQAGFLTQQHEAQHRHYRTYYGDAEWLIVERSGQPIGRLYIEEWEDQIRVIDISLTMDARGKGIGRAILEDVIEDARARAKFVSIHVEKNNPARRLYDRLGFEAVEDKGVYDLLATPPEPSVDQ